MKPNNGLTLPWLYPILDTGLLQASGVSVLDAASAMLDAGAGILQFRHKGHYSRDVFATAESVRELCRAANVPFVINDRADIAALLSADGLHLGQDDLPPAAARRVYPASAGFIGFSTHNEQQFTAAAAEAGQLSYIALGPVFSTTSKLNPDPVVGVEELRRIASGKVRPLVAIGGITLDHAADVILAGADSIAVISALLPPSLRTAVPTAIRQRTQQWLAVLSVL